MSSDDSTDPTFTDLLNSVRQCRLCEWLGISRDTFYDPTRIAILPMGFCYPSTGKSGDLPRTHKNLTETVRAWQDYAPSVFPLPHPSPRNNIWLKKNPWFTESLLPALHKATQMAIEARMPVRRAKESAP